MIVLAFSDNLSAENSKLCADSGIQQIQLLECMKSGSKEGGLTAQVSCKAKMQCLLRLFTCQPDYMAIKCHLCGGQIALHTRTCVCCQLLGPGR